ncbi:MAG: DUF4824 family protein [Acidihalobacter sp.]|uniref:DUF4824 family protein n=1 Tax=Acidihalobacter sp. TaxID=1872108 RepID=UPI00307F62F3
MKRKGFLLAIAFVLLANVVVLAGVAYNRSGAPTSELQLTAREVYIAHSYYGLGRENSGVSLYLRWHRPEGPGQSVLNEQKLLTIGFHKPRAYVDRRGWRHSMVSRTREAYLVLEYGGTAWQRLLETRRTKLDEELKTVKSETRRQRLQTSFERFAKTASRLVLVDVGNAPGALRARYPDRRRYLIAKARITAYQIYRRNGSGAPQPALRGSVSRLLPGTISVPHTDTAAILALNSQRYSSHHGTPVPTVTLAYGQRYEPWIVGVGKAGGGQPATE